ncbi:hypothetical protein ES703_117075 [subsurface metagenome]
MNEKVDKELESSEKVKKGVGGWLLLFIIYLTIGTPLVNFPDILGLLDFIFSYQLSIGSIIFHIIEIISIIGLVCFSIYAGVSLWRVKPNAVKLAKIFLTTALVYSVISTIIIYFVYPPIEPSLEEYFVAAISRIALRIVIFAIWFSYLTKSKRVKATFTEISYKKRKSKVEEIEEKLVAVYEKANLFKRFIAFLIDTILVFIITLLIAFLGASLAFTYHELFLLIDIGFSVLGALLTSLYILFRDGFDFMKNRSIGKMVVKLKPIIINTGAKCDLETSAKRNWLFAFVNLLSFFNPIFVQYITRPIAEMILIVLFSLPEIIYIIVEAVYVFTDDKGLRWGDKMAGTQVIEAK